MYRRVLRDGWNTQYATGQVNGQNRAITPFRAVNGLGDFLARYHVACDGPSQVHGSRIVTKRALRNHIQSCDTTGVPITSGNVKFVPDSSDYIKFKKLQALNRNYNDKSNGGSTNSEYVALMAIRR
jgi:hypothetical protein